MVLLFFWGIIFSAKAQSEDFSTGLLFDHEAFEQEVEMTATFSNDGQRAGDLPRWFSLRAYTPYPENQGSINSCIGWAMGYAALTTQEAFRQELTDRKVITENAYSALFIFNQVKEGSCASGAYIQTAAQFLKDNGDCKSTDFDFPFSDCDRQPTTLLAAESKIHAIKDFVALFKKDTPAKTKVVRTKRSIAEGKPVVVGMRIRESLKKVSAETPIWRPRPTRDRNLGGHALAVVGFNDSLGVFELMNSWGREWGDRGFFFVRYKDFAENTLQGLQLILPDTPLSEAELAAIYHRKLQVYEKQQAAQIAQQQAMAIADQAKNVQDIAQQAQAQSQDSMQIKSAEALLEQAQALLERASTEAKEAAVEKEQAEQLIWDTELETAALAGDFLLRVPLTDSFGTLITNADGSAQFETISSNWNGQYYELSKKNWEEGDYFQVMAHHIKKDNYVYLFSWDTNNKVEIHWPRNQRFKEHLNGYEVEGAGEGALVAYSNTEILIPGEDRVLVRENLEDDFICVLYSNQKIPNFQDRVRHLQEDCTGTFQERLEETFNDLLVPTNLINYEQQMMRCQIDRLENRGAIPLIIKVENQNN